MKIKRLLLTNFQGIKNLEIKFGAAGADIYGDNATGKTTVLNAYTWLLFNCASTGAKGFSPKPKAAEGDVHNLDTIVEAEFAANDGGILTLKKTFRELYKRKRGAATEEFSGHTTDYSVNGVPCTESEFTARLLDLGGVQQMRLLSMPDFFAETLDWTERRKILLDVCGDISDEDVISSSTELAPLVEYLRVPGSEGRSYTVEEYRKIAAAQKKEINEQLTAIPTRIDEVQRSMPDKVEDNAQLEKEMVAANEQLDQLRTKRQDLNDGEFAATEARKKVISAELDYTSAESNYRKRMSEETGKIQERIRSYRSMSRSEMDAATALLKGASADEAEADRMSDLRERLLAEYSEIASTRWNDANAICPTCGQALPADKVKESKADFNRRRSERLTAINERGHKEASASKIGELRQGATKNRELAAQHRERAQAYDSEADALEGSINQIPFATTEEAKELLAVIARLKDEEAGVHSGEDSLTAELDAEIRRVNDEIASIVRRRAESERASAQAKRIEELSQEEKRLSAEYERVEHGVYLCDQFVRSKVSMLTDKINSHFATVSFKLFETQVNGGLKETCEAMIPNADSHALVPYSYANNAARINAGIEIIRVLADHYGVKMPVFVDNAESITHMDGEGLQLIRLIVSEQDKALRAIGRDE